MIAIRDLRKRFGATTALDGITASIAQGAFTVLLGSNGAGKTTLLRCMAGLLSYEGTIAIGGHDVTSDGRAARRLIGYVPQRPSFPQDLTCGDVLELFARLRGLRPDAAWLARVGLEAHADAAVRTLSGGMKQRLALATALQAGPAVILFDEPAAHLDAPARRSLHRDLQSLAQSGRTVVLATHLAAEPLQIASSVMVLDRGQLVYDERPEGLGAAVRQRIIFTLNGWDRKELTAALGALHDVEIIETADGLVAATRAGRAFDLLAAAASGGVQPLGVHLEEPSIDTSRLDGGTVEQRT